MFDISAPYRTRNQVSFVWDADLIAERAFAARNILPIRNGLGLASTRAVNDPGSFILVGNGALRPAAGLIRPAVGNATLDRQGVAVFTLAAPVAAPVLDVAGASPQPDVNQSDVNQPGLNLFRREVLRFEIERLEAFHGMLVEFAGNRKFGNQKMLNIPSIRLRLAEARQKITVLSEIVDGNNLGNEEPILFQDIGKTVNDICDLLIRTAGGRAILAGGVVEMKLLFNLVNRIYL